MHLIELKQTVSKVFIEPFGIMAPNNFGAFFILNFSFKYFFCSNDLKLHISNQKLILPLKIDIISEYNNLFYKIHQLNENINSQIH